LYVNDPYGLRYPKIKDADGNVIVDTEPDEETAKIIAEARQEKFKQEHPEEWKKMETELQSKNGSTTGFEIIVEPNISKGIRGGVFSLGIEMYAAGSLRLEYDRMVQELKSHGLTEAEASAARNKLKEYVRSRQNQLAEAVTKKILKDRAASGYKGSMKNPFKPNAAVSGLGKIMCVAGKGMILVSVTMDVVDVVQSDEPVRSAVVAGGRMVGAWAGFKAGALACAWGGPWGVGICGFIGGGQQDLLGVVQLRE
jgi:hypothetical protein